MKLKAIGRSRCVGRDLIVRIVRGDNIDVTLSIK